MPQARRTAALALLLSLAPCVVAVPARAQADDPTTKAARARFQEGVDFYDKGQYENARAAFLQAYALKKHPAVLLNLAQSALRAGHPLEAARSFQQFLHDSTSLSAAQRDTANAGLAEARGKLGRIEVTAPSGTEISLDGERAGTAPLAEPLDVEPGAHVVKGRMPDGKEEQATVGVGAGQRASTRLGAPPVLPTPVPTPAPPPPPVQEAPPPVPPSDADAVSGSGGNGLFSPPRSMVPVWIGVGVALVGAGGAVGFAVAKGDAQANAKSVEDQIRANAAKDGYEVSGLCASSDAAVKSRYGKACNVLADNRSLVDTDALLANVGIVVAAAGLATAAGWYLFGPKKDDEPRTGLRSIVPSPLGAPGGTGLSFSGAF